MKERQIHLGENGQDREASPRGMQGGDFQERELCLGPIQSKERL